MKEDLICECACKGITESVPIISEGQAQVMLIIGIVIVVIIIIILTYILYKSKVLDEDDSETY